MSTKLFGFGLLLSLGLAAPGNVFAQGAANRPEPVKPSGPAAKKASDLIAGYTARIEKEIEQGRKEVARLRAEQRELIDLRYAMTDAIAELRGEVAANGTYNADSAVNSVEPNFAVGAYGGPVNAARPIAAAPFRRDFVYGLGSALPKEPTAEQREQLRRLAPRADLKRMTERLRQEIDETRADVDELAYELLELGQGLPVSIHRVGGGMGGPNVPWFGSMGVIGGMM